MRLRNGFFVAALALCLWGAVAVVPQAQAQSASATQQKPGDAYQNGFEHGRADAQRSLPNNDQPQDQWTTDQDRSAYRSGYDAGYSAGQSGTSGTVSSAPPSAGAGAMASPQPAAGDAGRYGYEDGLAAGRKDRDSGHSFSPTSSDMYKKGDHGWSSDFGDRDHYRQLYRQSYAQGYQQGYGANASNP